MDGIGKEFQVWSSGREKRLVRLIGKKLEKSPRDKVHLVQKTPEEKAPRHQARHQAKPAGTKPGTSLKRRGR